MTELIVFDKNDELDVLVFESISFTCSRWLRRHAAPAWTQLGRSTSFFRAQTASRVQTRAHTHTHAPLSLEWQWNWISPGWLKHVGLREPVSGVRVHHLSQSVGCVWCSRENEAAVALQMERHLRGANVFAGCIFFPLLGGAERGGDKERGETDATSAFY